MLHHSQLLTRSVPSWPQSTLFQKDFQQEIMDCVTKHSLSLEHSKKKRQWLPSTPLAFTNPQSSTQQSTFEVSCNGRFATWMHCQNQNSRENNLWIHACKVHFFLKKPLWEQSNSSAMLRDDYIVIFIVLQVCFVWWELSWEEKKRKV